MDNVTMHTVEHMLATLLRSSEIGDSVIYFGPMGCRTGFYLLTRDIAPEQVLTVLKKALADTVAYEGRVAGASRVECGNYRELDLAAAKKECAAYLAVLNDHKGDFSYAE
jgi:S-ribosylhomocysteine lyase